MWAWLLFTGCVGSETVAVQSCGETTELSLNVDNDDVAIYEAVPQLLDGLAVVDALSPDPNQIAELASLSSAELTEALADSRVGGIATARIGDREYREDWFFRDTAAATAYDDHGFVMHSPNCSNSCAGIAQSIDDAGWDVEQTKFVRQDFSYDRAPEELDIEFGPGFSFRSFQILQPVNGEPLRRGALLRGFNGGETVDVWLFYAGYRFVGAAEEAADRAFVVPEDVTVEGTGMWYAERWSPDDTLAVTQYSRLGSECQVP